MPTIRDFLTYFGWAELWVTLIIAAAIVLFREKHLIFKKKNSSGTNLKSME